MAGHCQQVAITCYGILASLCPASDVYRAAQVSVFDTINAAGGYSRKVRRLGEFHPELARLRAPDAQDIDDPLYGNAGGAGEQVLLWAAHKVQIG